MVASSGDPGDRTVAFLTALFPTLSLTSTPTDKAFSALFHPSEKPLADYSGTTPAEQAAVAAWLDRVGQGEFENPQGRAALDKELESRTFLVGSGVTTADLAVFASLQPYLAQATHATLLSHPSLTRHLDHIQHLSLTTAAVQKLGGLVQIDVGNVPVVVEPEREVKVKKPAAGAAPAASSAKEEKTAAAVKEEVKKEAPVKEEKKEGEKKEKKEKKPKAEAGTAGGGGKKAAAPPAAATSEAPAPWMVDLRVGKIIEVALHPDADSLYVEKIDIGEPEPRTVVSGLVKYIPIDQMLGKTLITVTNLKPANMRGVKSFAMVLCASSKDGKDGGVEFVDPPAGSVPGDRVFFEGFEGQTALEVLNPKKKIFEGVQPGFTTLENREAAWVDPETKKVHRIVTAKGVCIAPTFVGASLS